MADQRPTHLNCIEAGRQWFVTQRRGTKRNRAAPFAPAYLAPARSSGPDEQVPLTDMVALADIEHDETVAAMYDIVGPVLDAGTTPAAFYRASSALAAASQASSALAATEASALAAASRASSAFAAPRAAACGSPVKLIHCGGRPVQADQEMQVHAGAVKVELEEVAEVASDNESETVTAAQHVGQSTPGTSAGCRAGVPSCSSTFLPPLSGFNGDATDLRFLFARIFIPRHPNALPRSEWLSYPRLFSIVQLYAPARVWKQGPGSLKGFVIEWCKCLPTFAGLEQSKWCMRLKKTDDWVVPGQKQPSLVYKFCLECADLR